METTYHPIPTGNGRHLSEEAFSQFQAQFGGEIILKGDYGYEDARELWNALIDKSPGLIARCGGVADVIAAVNFARANNMKTAVRGGGHNVAGNGSCDDGMVIDLSSMRTVLVDPSAKTAKVQGGATWADVDRETQAFGLVCAGGVVSDTGVAGLTLGGGLSWMRRKIGMSIDNLLAVDMVLADGSFVHASAEENPDLFWAVRGGGGNFGIVTCFEYQLQELGPEVLFVGCMYPLEAAEEVMSFWLEFTRNAPDEVTTDCAIWKIADNEAFPEPLRNQPMITLMGMYFGSPEKGMEVMQPLREVTTPLLDLSNVYPYAAVQQMFDAFLAKGALRSYWKSIYLDDITGEMKDRIVARGNNRPSGNSLISIRHLQGAIARTPADATAFGDRSAGFLLSIDTMWTEAANDADCIAWTRDFWDEMRPFSNGQVYFNFVGDEQGGEGMLRDTFGKNYQRLARIKAKYDPENFFRINQNIPPA